MGLTEMLRLAITNSMVTTGDFGNAFLLKEAAERIEFLEKSLKHIAGLHPHVGVKAAKDHAREALEQ